MRIGLLLLMTLLLTVTILAWFIGDEHLTGWVAGDAPQLTGDQHQRVEAIRMWLDEARALGPLLAGFALLLFLRVGRLRDQIRELARRWGRQFAVVLIAAGVTAAGGLVVGVHNVVRNLRDYSGVRCPPDTVMIGGNARALIRMIRQKTADDARILVVTNNYRWFVNYYIVPRRLFQHQEKALPLADLDPDWIDEKKVDWVLHQDSGGVFRLVRRPAENP
jgi:hypothetical protein